MIESRPIPFSVGQWVRGERFYGRSSLIAEVLEGPRDSVWLLATRRMGKTSFLKQLEYLTNPSEKTGFLPLFWDLQGADNADELHLSFHDALLDAEEQLAKIGVDLSTMDPHDLFGSLGRLRRQVHAADRRVLLLCDEVEELITLHDQDPSLLRKLRRALQSGGQIRSVISSTIRLWVLSEQREDTSPFLHGFAPPLYLSTLTDDEATALLSQVNLDAASQPQIPPEDLAAMRHACDNHPYLLQLTGKRYLEVDDAAEAIERVATDEMVRYFFAVDFEMLTPLERQIIQTLGDTSAASSGSLEDRLRLSSTELTGSLLRLENLGFLRRDAEHRLILSNQFFQRWLAELSTQGAEASPKEAGSPSLAPATEESLLDDRYEILHLIGEGATGFVHVAFDRLLKTKLAIKILRPEYTDHPQILERFRQEIVLSRDLAHPNILRVYHLGSSKGRRYITMHWVDGTTLARRIKEEGALPRAEIMRIGLKLASALEAAHGQGVLHRDIKPQNVLLDHRGEPYLTDFGLARQLDDPGITAPGMFLGTPHYVSPEQAESAKLDERSDLYSLGVVLFEMSTGRRPFEGDTVLEVLEQHLKATPPAPLELRPDLDEGLSALILSCLEKDPSRRVASCHDLRHALESMR